MDMTTDGVFEELQRRNASAVTIHPNCMTGNRLKMTRMMENKLWFAYPQMAVYPQGSSISSSGYHIFVVKDRHFDFDVLDLTSTIWGDCV
jgi:hypothetical protein